MILKDYTNPADIKLREATTGANGTVQYAKDGAPVGNDSLVFDEVEKKLRVGVPVVAGVDTNVHCGDVTFDSFVNLRTVIPPAAPLLELMAGGNIDIGLQRYLVLYVTDAGETSKGDHRTLTTITGQQQIRITIPTSSDYRVTGRKVYRALDGYTFKLVAYIPDNTTTEFIDSLALIDLTDDGNDVWYAFDTTNKGLLVNDLPLITSNAQQVIIGNGAGSNVTSSSTGVAYFGVRSGENTTTALVSGFGHRSVNVAGANTTGVGSYAGFNSYSASATFIGHGAGHTSSGNDMTVAGNYAGFQFVAGDYVSAFGAFAGSPATLQVSNVVHSSSFGAHSYTTKSYQIAIGCDYTVETWLRGEVKTEAYSTTTPALTAKAKAGQTENILNVTDSNDNVLSSFDATGNLSTLAVKQTALSSDPPDPPTGQSVQWVSDGVGSGNAGDVMIKINVSGTTVIKTLITYA